MQEIYKIITLQFDVESNNGLIKKKKCKGILGRLYHIPKDSKYKILKDMEKNKFIKSLNLTDYKISNKRWKKKI